ncbi:hypothetical protein GALMADRAFT_774144 [Galerina marginata CBS 339.88]|uniref:Uncharacterized protein n=1 Tax=Galerina marginata (strain CBS 339.88) TaxID=685588 RepID=A0A067SM99_GALM3|nr:hypothetical protein GALMADRAFT_774144 [Galerina marginata CBS 339.88]
MKKIGKVKEAAHGWSDIDGHCVLREGNITEVTRSHLWGQHRPTVIKTAAYQHRLNSERDGLVTTSRMREKGALILFRRQVLVRLDIVSR